MMDHFTLLGSSPNSNSDFTSDTGYLDDPPSSSSPSSSRGVNSTTLFSHLAQRQYDSTQWHPGSPSSDSESSLDSAQLQREWEEQLEQLQLMFQIIIFPFVGKFMGRKFGYYLFDRYTKLGSPFARAFWRGIIA